MYFGTEALNEIFFEGLPANRPASEATYFCDAGCHPNPGQSLALVHDGQKFLQLAAVPSTGNHTAIYDALDATLAHAVKQGNTSVTIVMSSPLVCSQLETRQAKRLNDRLEATLSRITKLPSVKVVRIKAPVILEGVQFSDLPALRKHVRSSIKLLGKPAIRPSILQTVPAN